MVFGRIRTHDQDDVTVLEVDPVIRHSSSAERLCQSRYSSGVSYTSLVLKIEQAH